MPRGFFNVQNNGDVTRININGIIGDWGNSSEDISDQIDGIESDEIDVSIQSPGGSAFDGIAIHNVLVAHPARVTTRILGAAASAASVVFMAGDERVMPKNTHLMIHEPAVKMIQGRARELREAADFLDSITQSLLATYVPRVSVSESDVLDMIIAETWMTASEAYDYGFATKTTEANRVVALSNDFLNRFKNLPENINGQSLEAVNNIKEFECYLRESGGYSRSNATAIVAVARKLLQSDSAQMTAIANVLNNFKLGA